VPTGQFGPALGRQRLDPPKERRRHARRAERLTAKHALDDRHEVVDGAVARDVAGDACFGRATSRVSTSGIASATTRAFGAAETTAATAAALSGASPSMRMTSGCEATISGSAVDR
jgi:hypothetical protein